MRAQARNVQAGTTVDGFARARTDGSPVFRAPQEPPEPDRLRNEPRLVRRLGGSSLRRSLAAQWTGENLPNPALYGLRYSTP